MTLIQFDEQNGTFPFNTVLKQLHGEDGASVVGSFIGAQTRFANQLSDRARWLGASRDWWGGVMAVNGEVTRQFTPRAGSADEILDGAFNIVRHGDARAVTVNIALCDVGLDLSTAVTTADSE